MVEYAYRVIYDPIEEGGYQVIVPSFPEIITYGRTIDEAREMARDAILCHIEGLRKDGEEIPRDPFLEDPPIIEQVKVAV
ncbi:MAG: type II toxin-antitoxin system HicB family antitoxin [Acidobacteria bacterium]|nr:type II toxin-antitoxin system HicB family antitoxin [Acidobacteriota bacterium]